MALRYSEAILQTPKLDAFGRNSINTIDVITLLNINETAFLEEPKTELQ